ncbi:MAG: formylglycine-generating enzyme family protein [Deltaproteobacteria bacterium]|nr:formylglycine-generating enzyme family protein [Deltaproteobacteria bacterium]MBW2085470.1 formylglycine-generating enzyme family protein [Deltaproteobacteria bacterium]
MKKILFPLLLAVSLVLFVVLANVYFQYAKYRPIKALPSPIPALDASKTEVMSWQPFTNAIGMKFVYMPLGRFIMGSPPTEIGRSDGEYQHEVILIKGFFIQTTEVTQKQWNTLMAKNPSRFTGDDRPVEQVAWLDCQAFIKALNRIEGHDRYRLPTEAEWEYACRAGTTTAFAFGDLTTTGRGYDLNLDRIGWYAGNSSASTHPVAQKEPNAWGLYDMHGNVWEWCQDRYERWYGKFTTGAVTDPAGGRWGRRRVFRGGSWFAPAEYCRSADRLRAPPDFKSSGLGFRVVRSE